MAFLSSKVLPLDRKFLVGSSKEAFCALVVVNSLSDARSEEEELFDNGIASRALTELPSTAALALCVLRCVIAMMKICQVQYLINGYGRAEG